MERDKLARLLRWIANEAEAGRAEFAVDMTLDSDIVEEPRSWYDDAATIPKKSVRFNGCDIVVTGKTMRDPRAALDDLPTGKHCAACGRSVRDGAEA